MIAVIVSKEGDFSVPIKAKHAHSLWHPHFALAIYPGETSAHVQKRNIKNVHCCAACNSGKKMETANISIAIKMLKWMVVFSYYPILRS